MLGTNPYATGYTQPNAYQSAYGQTAYGQTGYDQSSYAMAGQTGYGQTAYDSGAYPANGTNYPATGTAYPPYPATGTSATGYLPADAGGYGFQSTGTYTDAAPASPMPKPSPSTVDKAPDPIAPTTFDQVGEELSILTYNVWGLPGLLGTKRSDRFSRLGPTLNRYDVVTLQAAYSDDIESLKQNTGFAYHARINNSSLLKTNSGLYTLSKYPILKTEYEEFDHCSGTDCLTRKGILLTRIEHPKLGPIDIYSTHYQAGDSAKAKDIRSQQDNRELQEMIQRNRSSFPVIVMGDFEMVPDQPEYQDLLQRLPLTDAYRKMHPNTGGYTYTPDNPYLKGEGIPQRLDYIFLLAKTGIEIKPLSVDLAYDQPVDGWMLSNHSGVSARLQIRVTQP